MSGSHGSAAAMYEKVRVIYRDPERTAELLGRKIPDKERKVSNLPVTSVNVAFGQLNLRSMKLTSLEGLMSYPELHTLYLQDNFLMNIEHVGDQPDLTNIQAQRNSIIDFANVERMPKLHEVAFEGNPIARLDVYPIICCLCLNPSLHKIDGKVVTRQQRELVGLLDRPAVRIALNQGWMLSLDDSNDGAEVNLPVEEFLFRLDPAVLEVLDQGVPVEECTINIHTHLRKSYEKLTCVQLLGARPVLKDAPVTKKVAPKKAASVAEELQPRIMTLKERSRARADRITPEKIMNGGRPVSAPKAKAPAAKPTAGSSPPPRASAATMRPYVPPKKHSAPPADRPRTPEKQQDDGLPKPRARPWAEPPPDIKRSATSLLLQQKAVKKKKAVDKKHAIEAEPYEEPKLDRIRAAMLARLRPLTPPLPPPLGQKNAIEAEPYEEPKLDRIRAAMLGGAPAPGGRAKQELEPAMHAQEKPRHVIDESKAPMPHVRTRVETFERIVSLDDGRTQKRPPSGLKEASPGKSSGAASSGGNGTRISLGGAQRRRQADGGLEEPPESGIRPLGTVRKDERGLNESFDEQLLNWRLSANDFNSPAKLSQLINDSPRQLTPRSRVSAVPRASSKGSGPITAANTDPAQLATLLGNDQELVSMLRDLSRAVNLPGGPGSGPRSGAGGGGDSESAPMQRVLDEAMNDEELARALARDDVIEERREAALRGASGPTLSPPKFDPKTFKGKLGDSLGSSKGLGDSRGRMKGSQELRDEVEAAQSAKKRRGLWRAGMKKPTATAKDADAKMLSADDAKARFDAFARAPEEGGARKAPQGAQRSTGAPAKGAAAAAAAAAAAGAAAGDTLSESSASDDEGGVGGGRGLGQADVELERRRERERVRAARERRFGARDYRSSGSADSLEDSHRGRGHQLVACRRTMVGKLRREACKEAVQIWADLCDTRASIRVALIKDEPLLHPLGTRGRQERSFCLWVLNTARLLCIRAMFQRTERRMVRVTLSKWKLFVGMERSAVKTTTRKEDFRIVAMQLAVQAAIDPFSGGGIQRAIHLYRNAHSVKTVRPVVESRFHASTHSGLLRSYFVFWVDAFRNKKLEVLHNRVDEIENKVGSILTAHSSPPKTPLVSVSSVSSALRESMAKADARSPSVTIADKSAHRPPPPAAAPASAAPPASAESSKSRDQSASTRPSENLGIDLESYGALADVIFTNARVPLDGKMKAKIVDMMQAVSDAAMETANEDKKEVEARLELRESECEALLAHCQQLQSRLFTQTTAHHAHHPPPQPPPHMMAPHYPPVPYMGYPPPPYPNPAYNIYAQPYTMHSHVHTPPPPPNFSPSTTINNPSLSSPIGAFGSPPEGKGDDWAEENLQWMVTGPAIDTAGSNDLTRE